MQKAFCFLTMSACFFACQRQQASDEVLAQIQTEVPVPAEGPEAIENTPTPINLAPIQSPVKSITPQPEASVTPTATETPILSPTETPTPTISSTPDATVQRPSAAKNQSLLQSRAYALTRYQRALPFRRQPYRPSSV